MVLYLTNNHVEYNKTHITNCLVYYTVLIHYIQGKIDISCWDKQFPSELIWFWCLEWYSSCIMANVVIILFYKNDPLHKKTLHAKIIDSQVKVDDIIMSHVQYFNFDSINESHIELNKNHLKLMWAVASYFWLMSTTKLYKIIFTDLQLSVKYLNM